MPINILFVQRWMNEWRVNIENVKRPLVSVVVFSFDQVHSSLDVTGIARLIRQQKTRGKIVFFFRIVNLTCFRLISCLANSQRQSVFVSIFFFLVCLEFFYVEPFEWFSFPDEKTAKIFISFLQDFSLN